MLVTGFMRSIKGRAGPRIKRKYPLGEFFEGNECRLVVKRNGGFEWVSWAAGEAFKAGRKIP